MQLFLAGKSRAQTHPHTNPFVHIHLRYAIHRNKNVEREKSREGGNKKEIYTTDFFFKLTNPKTTTSNT
jgi:hypothetical protein